MINFEDKTIAINIKTKIKKKQKKNKTCLYLTAFKYLFSTYRHTPVISTVIYKSTPPFILKSN